MGAAEGFYPTAGFLAGMQHPVARRERRRYAVHVQRLNQLLDSFVSLVEAGKGMEAMERFYADEVVVFENRELARAGKRRCIEFEQAELSRVAKPPRLKALKHACNEAQGVSFVEWQIRFETATGRPMRLEEVAVQIWRDGCIAEERFYYEGVIDEGD